MASRLVGVGRADPALGGTDLGATARALLQPIREEAWAIGLNKGNASLLTGVNAFLKTFRESGGLAKLGDQYLASEKKLMESMGIPFILR